MPAPGPSEPCRRYRQYRPAHPSARITRGRPEGQATRLFMAHDLVRKPVPTFRDHALILLHDALAADDLQIAAEMVGFGGSRKRSYVGAIERALLGDADALDIGLAVAE